MYYYYVHTDVLSACMELFRKCQQGYIKIFTGNIQYCRFHIIIGSRGQLELGYLKRELWSAEVNSDANDLSDQYIPGFTSPVMEPNCRCDFGGALCHECFRYIKIEPIKNKLRLEYLVRRIDYDGIYSRGILFKNRAKYPDDYPRFDAIGWIRCSFSGRLYRDREVFPYDGGRITFRSNLECSY